MDPEKIKELLEEMGKATALLREKAADAEQEKKAYGEFSVETKQTLEAINSRITEIEAELQRPAKGSESDEIARKSAERKSAFFNFMRGGIANLSSEEKTALRDVPTEMKALVEDATGLILVPEDLDTQVIHKVGKLSIMRPLVAVRPTNRDHVRVRSLNELTVGWGKLETGTAITESSLTPTDAKHYVEDLYGLTK